MMNAKHPLKTPLRIFADSAFFALASAAYQQQFVEIARKADETKASLKKSIADVEQVIKGLING